LPILRDSYGCQKGNMAGKDLRLEEIASSGIIPQTETLFDKLVKQITDDLTGANQKEWPELPVHEIQKAFRESPAQTRGFTGGRGVGKALALNTPIPTPAGWTTMGQIQVGDTVLDEHGSPCRVIAATEVMRERPCYAVRFSSGETVVADAQHEWVTVSDGKSVTVTTEQIASDFGSRERAIHGPTGPHWIESAVRVRRVPVRCIQVDSPSHQYLVTKAMIPTHNSFIGALDTLMRAKAGRLYLVTNPTYSLLRDSTIRSYEEVAKKLGCYKKMNWQGHYMVIATRDGGEATINFRSADRPETVARGPNYSGWHGDEASLCKEDLPKLALATLRGGGELGWVSLTFTPNGKGHWTYEWFYDKDGNPTQNTELFRAGTRQNPFLPAGFYEMVANRYVPGSTLARQELEGEFVDLSGLTFQDHWFKRVKEVPREATRVRYWDKAAADAEKNERGDWSAGILMARTPDGVFWIEDSVRGQWSPFKRNEIIKDTARRDTAKYDGEVTIYFEREGGSGGKTDALLSLMDLAEFPVYPDSPVGKGNKEVRSRALRAQAEAGNVRILEADWAAVLLDELVSFPKGKHDDQVDACSGAYNMLAAMAGYDTSGAIIAYPQSPETEAAEAKAAAQGIPYEPKEMDLLEYFREYAGESKKDENTPHAWARKWMGGD
jgi:predicted phage terminase large subunit-like protein